MKKMLYASPFLPMRSGISEYSEILLNSLKEYYDITLLKDNYKLSSKVMEKEFEVLTYAKDKIKFEKYDFILYNFGNQPEYHLYIYDCALRYPGYIILHDFILYYLTVGYYEKKGILMQKIYELEGVEGISLVKDSLNSSPYKDLMLHKGLSHYLPMNEEILMNSKGCFVHSEIAFKSIKYFLPQKRAYIIPLLNITKQYTYDNDVLCKFIPNINMNNIIICSLGYIAHTKQNDIICEAVNFYNRNNINKIYYIMVGDGSFADSYLNEYIIKTNFVDDNDYMSILKKSRLVLNLRYPSNGEASAAVIQAMYMGKACVVTNYGWFNELPDDVILKVLPNVTKEELCNIFESIDQNSILELGERAKKFVEEKCSPQTVANIIHEKLELDS
jgi:glycosyltransferase involved in cell wall biosynthesis